MTSVARHARLGAWWVMAAVAALLTACGDDGLSGGGGLGSVSGYVYVQSNTLIFRPQAAPSAGEVPADGASVLITDAGGAFVDSTGFFRVMGVPSGAHGVRAMLPGYNEAVATVNVVANQDVRVGAPVDGGRQWTVLLYLHADNAREAAAIDLINDLEALPAMTGIDVAVQMDRATGFDSSSDDWTTTRRFRVRPDNDPRVMTSARLSSEGGAATDAGELDMGDAATLESFLRDAKAALPASRYLLVLWDGSALQRSPLLHGSMLADIAGPSGAGTSLPLTGLSSALSPLGRADLVVLDAGPGQLLETAYELRQRASLLLGSQAALPDSGFPYAAWLTILAERRNDPTESLARRFADATVEAYSARHPVTASVLRASELNALASDLRDFVQRLQALPPTDDADLLAARDAAQAYGAGLTGYHGQRDLLDFVSRAATAVNDGTLTIRALELTRQVQQTVAYSTDAGDSVADSRGVSLYLPTAQEYLGSVGTRDGYAEFDLSADTGWDDWLATWLGRVD